MDFSGKEVDMVYSQTSGGGFKFSFNFEFEWELLPGIPGVVQDGYSDNTSYGGDNKKPYKPVDKPYEKPTQAPYKPTQKPYKPTQKPYKPTQKPIEYTTKKPVYTTKKPSYTTKKPVYTTKKPVYTTKKPTYTTKKPNYTTKKPSYTTKKPYGGGGGGGKPYVKPPLYNNKYKCPWETNHGYSTYAGDCPGHKGKCNLKYFKVCGQSFFNKVYNDVFKWQDAAQLIPMVTEKLVPLGAKFEKVFNTKCNGLNNNDRTIQELLGFPVNDDERDIASCKAIAGAVPCELINFHGITTARAFHLKIETLYHEFLKKHCNKEWRVHFEALMIRMRHSLFCDDGGSSDHDGYVVSPPPPVYSGPGNTPAPPTKPYNPVPNPTKPPNPPQPTKAPYNPPQPTQAPYKPPKPTTTKPYNPPVTPKPYNPTKKPGKPYKPPTYKPVVGCPWEKPANYGAYEGDCPGNQNKCNLKYFKVCGESFFNKVYNDVCHWQDAAQLIPMVTQKLVPLGAKFERVKGVKCNGMNYKGKSLQELMGGAIEENDRDIASCKPIAGAVP